MINKIEMKSFSVNNYFKVGQCNDFLAYSKATLMTFKDPQQNS